MSRRRSKGAGRGAPTPAPRRRATAGATIARDGGATTSAAAAQWLTRLAWLAIALFAGTLLWVVLGPHKIGDYSTETDFYGAYAAGARALQHGHLDPSRYGVVGPLYEIALALTGFVARDLLLAAELISVVSVVA